MDYVNILCTSDLHGYVEGIRGKAGFYETLQELKKEYPHSLLIDNGDYLSGSRLATYLNIMEEGRPLVDMANRIGYDVMIPGNHEFDLGIDRLMGVRDAFRGSYLCCNLMDRKGEYIFKPWCLLKNGGLKIGIIGLVTGNLSQLTEVENLEGVHVIRPVLALKDLLPQIRGKADLVILCYHGGIEREMQSGKWTQYDTGEDEAYRLIETFPEIDGLICGHQHREEAGCKNNTLYVQPGYGGTSIGRLFFSKEGGRILRRKAELIHAADHRQTAGAAERPLLQWDEGYQRWKLGIPDLSHLPSFIERHFSCDGFLFEVRETTREGFYNSFSAPYHVSLYQFSDAEWKEILELYEKTDPDGKLLMREREEPGKQWHRILSNIQTLPYDRIIQRFFINFPDTYEMELFRKG
ncbi:metallophosphoesterase [Lachnospiraceae bacterium 54-53]